MGKEKMLKAVEDVVEAGLGEDELVDRLYDVLDTDTLPEQDGQDFEEYISQLRKSIFIPPIGHASPPQQIPPADQIATAEPTTNGVMTINGENKSVLKDEERPDAETTDAMTGIYGTQRQTIVLVDWDGHVTFRERSLWDENGMPIERGMGDMNFEFHIEGWN